MAINGSKKPNVFVIDLWSPNPDRDSASLRMVNLLSILWVMTNKLTFGADDTPEWRSNFTEWRPEPEVNIELLNGKPAILKHLEKYGGMYDAVILSRLIAAKKYFNAVKKYAPDAAIIFDTTDLKHLRGYRGAKITGNVKLLQTALAAKRDELSIINRADSTLVVSSSEKEILAQECPDAFVKIVSNIHETHGSSKPFFERSGILFLGPFQHHPNFDAMEFFLDSILPLLRTKMPELDILIIGSDPPDWLLKAQNSKLRVMDYVPDLTPYFNSYRLSFAPLRYGAGVKGKVLMSMGYGVPVVATPIAMEGIPVEHKKSMYIADEPQAFANAIQDLYQNENLWNTISKNGLQIVDQHFSKSVAEEALNGLFKSLGLLTKNGS